MIDFLASLFGYILNFIYNFVQNYGLAIILFSILIKILMIPISIKQQKTMKKNVKMQAKMKEIQFKYKNNPEMLNQATIELYKTEKINPFSGCLSAIVQLILLLAVFYLVRSPLTYMKKIDPNVINKYSTMIKQYELSELSGYPEIDIIREIDNIKELRNKDVNEDDKVKKSEINDEELDSMKMNMDFLGLNLAQIPTKSSDWKAYIIPALYVIVSVISMRMTTSMTSGKKKDKEIKETDKEKALVEKKEEEFDPMAQMNKNMSLMFPIMYLAVALIAPLGLALYWLTNSLLMIVERLALNKLIKDEEEK